MRWLASKALGSKRTGTESDPLQMLTRLCLLPIYQKRDNPAVILTLGGNGLLAEDWELAKRPSSRLTWRVVTGWLFADNELPGSAPFAAA
ncbi:MAG: hypothetical protein DMG22_07335 [Acidobacteria bacterium]|nr:MAG: hypothetical protein DMG22_07335 [Acidobacteriota bacterium]